MKNKLKEYIPLSDDQRNAIWEHGIFVLDANVLLNMCRYSKQSCDELIKIIEKHKDSLWLPYQVAMEFFDNRLGVIEGIKNGFSKLLSNISMVDDVLNKELKFNEFRTDTAHNLDQLKKDITSFRKREEAKIRKWQKEFEDSNKEAILDIILSLYEGKVGDDYNEVKLKELYEEGERRQREGIPPGYADWKDKIKNGLRHASGDLIWWKQAIDYARDKRCDLVIVTDDKKDDWWYKVSGKTFGPRVELIREFDKETNGQKFLMYQTHQFMTMAKRLDGAMVSDSSIKEAKETGAVEYNRLVESYKAAPYSISDLTLSKYMAGDYNSALGNSLLAGSLTTEQGGIHGLAGLSDGKGKVGVYDPSTHLTLPKSEGISTLMDFYEKRPNRVITLSDLFDETNRLTDNFIRKKD